jgi:ATP-dependent Clp protease ATP-binding subunit ClpA
MFERFTQEARQVVKAAETLASGLGSPTIEAEHLLLALADCQPVLADAGLDHDGVLAALAEERERSLLAVGISAADFDLPPAPLTRPRMAASSKVALERAVRAAVSRSDKRIAGGHILLGVLAAEAGTVPRALAISGIDRQELRDRAAAALT